MAIAAAASGKRNESAQARILGSATSGAAELFTFHPVDTVAKRLMNNNKKIFGTGLGFRHDIGTLNEIIFRNKAQAGTMQKYLSLFPGLGFAAGYKILQRIYKFGGQPFVVDYLTKHHRGTFARLFGERESKTMMHATAGSIIGVGEVVLLPLDVMKIKLQTNPEYMRGMGVLSVIKQEGWGLYRGTGWTAARNAPGSFALFGGSAVTKEYVFGLEDFSKATFFQNFCASVGGAFASLTVSAPLDVIKTRIQARSHDQVLSGRVILQRMIVEEGFRAFFKGLTPKLLVVGPKLVFSFTIAQQMIPLFHRLIDGDKQ
ncbi:hypothetical protein CXG81DRAFT_9743 [Caulochytrium protostelioides]|uniref:Mitochondrial carrier n=1 Tax=Caulochytrium protostelioides TaxID=1555241 RepID=A0A4P9XDN4_9FUNG|nr:hypothetical protein CXG81DRAFT_9743 [Caulochytrium protostelioides]|eukprot:RKP03280.1 hypothetical protein CXG81DRAFT_9743 [Caulochytrium protostelioides]